MAKDKKIKNVYFKVDGEFVKLPVTAKEEKVGTDQRVRRFLKAIDPKSGKTLTRQVSQKCYDKVDA